MELYEVTDVIKERAKKFEELTNFYAIRNSFCKGLLKQLEERTEEQREKFWLNQARAYETVKEFNDSLTEGQKMCREWDEYHGY